jgi:Major Facilitator Superfamily
MTSKSSTRGDDLSGACRVARRGSGPILTILVHDGDRTEPGGVDMPEGIGAALILPAIVALVASIFGREQRPRAYGLVASAGAIAVAAGPLIGGLFTTYLSWRWVFAGEVVVVLVILALTRRMADTPPEAGVALDLMGTALSALGLGLIVYGILRSGTWGFVRPKPGAPEWLGLSPVVWLILAGGLVVGIFVRWENHRLEQGRAALIDPAILENLTLRGGLTSFFFQYLLQAGLFFAVPLLLSVALGLSAVATGVRLLPLSITLLLAAAGIPKMFAGLTASSGATRVRCIVRRHRGDDRRSRCRSGPRDRDLAHAARGARCRRAGVSARSRHRVVRPRRAERRGGRPAEHGHQPWRLHQISRRGTRSPPMSSAAAAKVCLVGPPLGGRGCAR